MFSLRLVLIIFAIVFIYLKRWVSTEQIPRLQPQVMLIGTWGPFQWRCIFNSFDKYNVFQNNIIVFMKCFTIAQVSRAVHCTANNIHRNKAELASIAGKLCITVIYIYRAATTMRKISQWVSDGKLTLGRPGGVDTTPLAFSPCNFYDDSNRKNRLCVSVTRDGRHILTYVTSSWRCHVTYVMTSNVHDGGQNTLFLPLFVNRDIC